MSLTPPIQLGQQFNYLSLFPILFTTCPKSVFLVLRNLFSWRRKAMLDRQIKLNIYMVLAAAYLVEKYL
jgi:hypothetical protein